MCDFLFLCPDRGSRVCATSFSYGQIGWSCDFLILWTDMAVVCVCDSLLLRTDRAVVCVCVCVCVCV